MTGRTAPPFALSPQRWPNWRRGCCGPRRSRNYPARLQASARLAPLPLAAVAMLFRAGRARQVADHLLLLPSRGPTARRIQPLPSPRRRRAARCGTSRAACARPRPHRPRLARRSRGPTRRREQRAACPPSGRAGWRRGSPTRLTVSAARMNRRQRRRRRRSHRKRHLPRPARRPCRRHLPHRPRPRPRNRQVSLYAPLPVPCPSHPRKSQRSHRHTMMSVRLPIGTPRSCTVVIVKVAQTGWGAAEGYAPLHPRLRVSPLPCGEFMSPLTTYLVPLLCSTGIRSLPASEWVTGGRGSNKKRPAGFGRALCVRRGVID